MDGISTSMVIVPVGIAVWGLISGLLVYIWRSDRAVLAKRISDLETAKESSTKDLLSNPILTISSHSILCDDVWKHFTERLQLMENSIKSAIRIAILEAAKNGRE